MSLNVLFWPIGFMVCKASCFSAHHSSKEWLSEPSCQLKPLSCNLSGIPTYRTMTLWVFFVCHTILCKQKQLCLRRSAVFAKQTIAIHLSFFAQLAMHVTSVRTTGIPSSLWLCTANHTLHSAITVALYHTQPVFEAFVQPCLRLDVESCLPCRCRI